MQNDNSPLGFKYNRVLTIYSMLMNGEVLNKRYLAELFNVAPRSIQRDIEDLRCFLTDHEEIKKELVYNNKLNGYHLVNKNDDKPNIKSNLEDIDMAENETKKKTTKKTTSTRKKAKEQSTRTLNLDEVKEEIGITSESKVSIDNYDEKIQKVKDSVGSIMKSVTNSINANANNIIITTKAESSKTNKLIKEQTESINSNLNKIEETLGSNLTQINMNDIKMQFDLVNNNFGVLYSSLNKFLEEDKQFSDTMSNNYNKIYENISLIMDAITNGEDMRHFENLLVAQNQYIKELMEKNNDRIDLNSERLNMIIGSISALTESEKENHTKIMEYFSENSDINRERFEDLKNCIDDSLSHYTNQLNAAKDHIVDYLEKLNGKFNGFVIVYGIISILTFISAFIGLFV